MPRKNQYYGGIIGASPLVAPPTFDITFTAKGAGGGGGQFSSGGAGGLAEATFSSTDFCGPEPVPATRATITKALAKRS